MTGQVKGLSPGTPTLTELLERKYTAIEEKISCEVTVVHNVNCLTNIHSTPSFGWKKNFFKEGNRPG